MNSKKLVLVGGAIVLGVAISVFFIFNKFENKMNMGKKIGTSAISEKEKERAIKAMEKQVKILAQEQQKGQMKQEEVLKEYDVKIFKEINKQKRIKLIKEVIAIVGKYGIDASAIPTLDVIKEKLSDSDEKKLLADKIKLIMKNRDMRAELEEYEKNNK